MKLGLPQYITILAAIVAIIAVVDTTNVPKWITIAWIVIALVWCILPTNSKE